MELKKRSEVVNRERLEKIGEIVCEINRLGLATNRGTFLSLGWHPHKPIAGITDEHGFVIGQPNGLALEAKLNELRMLIAAN